ncbi:hypothetical protein PTSG_02160 [Salpingoeca rosetta]|uniref:Fork-head domain-containing protein n=1 Tax=Salpingoeca rosetta (strain ATCC 50818 / BSB-021) TaxID=946362 RepID=F2U1D7_SALR5|nr:uncharacterized protein PTSG_02160 [Salpingoeca rosetta]EGD81439.1 hypothetical protein PTSG_02160 [Salpingoeca rosetta]|eukprot:XP_004996643.1 hypothetical protein PTSG_02160 [Salpingoeca rosetta]
MSPSPIPGPRVSASQQAQQHRQRNGSTSASNVRCNALRTSSRCNSLSNSLSSSLSSSLASLTWLTNPLTCRQSPSGTKYQAPQITYASHDAQANYYNSSDYYCRSSRKQRTGCAKTKATSARGGHGHGRDDEDDDDDDDYDDVFGPEFKQEKENSRSGTPEDILSFDWASNPHKKPPFAYATLIFMALRESDKDKLSLAEIYDYILDNFAYYRHARCGWKNSIRHNLSQEKCFLKVDRDGTERGKGGYWMLRPDFVDFEQMKTRRRRKFKRRRSVPEPTTDAESAAHASDSDGGHSTASSNSPYAREKSTPSHSRRSSKAKGRGKGKGAKGKKAQAAAATAVAASRRKSGSRSSKHQQHQQQQQLEHRTVSATLSSPSSSFTSAGSPHHVTSAAPPHPPRRNAPYPMKPAAQKLRRLTPSALAALRDTTSDATTSLDALTAAAPHMCAPGGHDSAVTHGSPSINEADLSHSMSHLGLTMALGEDAGKLAPLPQQQDLDMMMDLGTSFAAPMATTTDDAMAHRPSFQAILSQLHTPGTSFAQNAFPQAPPVQAGPRTRNSGDGADDEIDDSDKPIPSDWLL